MTISSDDVKRLVLTAFVDAWNHKDGISKNNLRSSYFVSNLAKQLETKYGGEALVQKTESNGKKHKGEWLLDIALVEKSVVSTYYKNRKSEIIEKILFAVESEFSTNLPEFCTDFAKLLHIRSNAYLYICGLNQKKTLARNQYIEAQSCLAKDLVKTHKIYEPFFLVFVPTPGGIKDCKSLWDSLSVNELSDWIHIIKCHE